MNILPPNYILIAWWNCGYFPPFFLQINVVIFRLKYILCRNYKCITIMSLSVIHLWSLLAKLWLLWNRLKCFQIACATAVCRTQLMVLAQSRGAALNKGFADIKKSGGNSGFRSKVGVRLQLGVRLVIQDLRYLLYLYHIFTYSLT
jgi:hypothetical protein